MSFKNTDKISVVEMIYHREMDKQATGTETRFTRDLMTKGQQPYFRTTTAKEEWKQLSYGWLTDDKIPVGMLVIKNEPEKRATLPSEEEQTALDGQILELGIETRTQEATIVPLGIIVHPNESIRFSIDNTQLYYVRSVTKEPIKFTLQAYPG